jgi:hypothetical protein
MEKNIGRRRPQGRRRLVHERRQYFELMDKGYSNAAACKIVGINVRTGSEWKNGSVRDWTPVNGSISIESPYRPELGRRTYEREEIYT